MSGYNLANWWAVLSEYFAAEACSLVYPFRANTEEIKHIFASTPTWSIWLNQDLQRLEAAGDPSSHLKQG